MLVGERREREGSWTEREVASAAPLEVGKEELGCRRWPPD